MCAIHGRSADIIILVHAKKGKKSFEWFATINDESVKILLD